MNQFFFFGFGYLVYTYSTYDYIPKYIIYVPVCKYINDLI